MDTAWSRLSIQQKRIFFLQHAEWVVFQALAQGVPVDKYSIDALVKVRRSMQSDSEERPSPEFTKAVYDAYGSTRDIFAEKPAQITTGVVAYICYSTLIDAFRDNAKNVSETYVRIFFLDKLPESIHRSGPMMHWFIENNVDVNRKPSDMTPKNVISNKYVDLSA